MCNRLRSTLSRMGGRMLKAFFPWQRYGKKQKQKPGKINYVPVCNM
jgi:hypothetical protein